MLIYIYIVDRLIARVTIDDERIKYIYSLDRYTVYKTVYIVISIYI